MLRKYDRAIALVLAVLMLLSATGCAQFWFQPDDGTSTAVTNPSEGTGSAEKPTESTTAPSEVTDPSETTAPAETTEPSTEPSTEPPTEAR